LSKKKAEHVLRLFFIWFLRKHTLRHSGPPAKIVIKIVHSCVYRAHSFSPVLTISPLIIFCQPQNVIPGHPGSKRYIRIAAMPGKHHFPPLAVNALTVRICSCTFPFSAEEPLMTHRHFLLESP